MAKIQIIRGAFFIALFVLVLQVLGVFFSLLSYFWWFDIPMHFFAGVCVGFLSIWGYFFSGVYKGRSATALRMLVVALIGTIVVGLLWEFFEYSQGIMWNALENYPLDTAKDLVVDVMGAYVTYLYAVSKGFHDKLSE